MLALSIQQPWAWLIANGHKDVENRTWRVSEQHRRGTFLIHAGRMPDAEWAPAETLRLRRNFGVVLPCEPAALELGGIVGVARLVDCVSDSDSPWFVGPYGFVVDRAAPVPFVPFKGKLGFFEVPNGVVELPVGYVVEPMHMGR